MPSGLLLVLTATCSMLLNAGTLFHSGSRYQRMAYRNKNEMLVIAFEIQYVNKDSGNLVPDFGIRGIEISSQA